MTTPNVITQDLIDNAYSYTDYVALFENVVTNNTTTGPDKSEAMVSYTQLNWQRHQRAEKNIDLQQNEIDSLSKTNGNFTLLVITEPWCGDAASIVPVLAKLASSSEKLDLKLILRDEHPEVMDNYLTNGSRSIPKVVILDEDLNELGVWGPRPQAAMKLLHEFKSNPDMDRETFYKNIQKFYAKNKGVDIQTEIAALIKASEVKA